MFKFRTIVNIALKQGRCFSKSSGVSNGEPLTVPAPDGPTVFSAKIEKLVNDISQLTLIEVSELSTALKQRLNLPDSPAFPVGGFALSKAEVEEEVAPKQVQTSFTVKLLKFEEKQKVALIKECKNLLEGMNLVQAKICGECPYNCKADIAKDEAENKEALSKVGAEIVIE
uniref:Putative 39s ribosomal protein l12 n=1 Tax=Rhodnius prolixus TaxID=13249 RepID=R4G4F0_RHOPR